MKRSIVFPILGVSLFAAACIVYALMMGLWSLNYWTISITFVLLFGALVFSAIGIRKCHAAAKVISIASTAASGLPIMVGGLYLFAILGLALAGENNDPKCNLTETFAAFDKSQNYFSNTLTWNEYPDEQNSALAALKALEYTEESRDTVLSVDFSLRCSNNSQRSIDIDAGHGIVASNWWGGIFESSGRKVFRVADASSLEKVRDVYLLAKEKRESAYAADWEKEKGRSHLEFSIAQQQSAYIGERSLHWYEDAEAMNSIAKAIVEAKVKKQEEPLLAKDLDQIPYGNGVCLYYFQARGLTAPEVSTTITIRFYSTDSAWLVSSTERTYKEGEESHSHFFVVYKKITFEPESGKQILNAFNAAFANEA